MTVHVFIHLIAKRAKTTSLLNSGATENFLNLKYAKWLHLPIKKMLHPRKLFNVDETKNKAGQLQYYCYKLFSLFLWTDMSARPPVGLACMACTGISSRT